MVYISGYFFDLVHFALDWVLYPWTNWAFNVAFFDFPLYYLLVGAAVFGLCVLLVEYLAGFSTKLKFLGMFFGG